LGAQAIAARVFVVFYHGLKNSVDERLGVFIRKLGDRIKDEHQPGFTGSFDRGRAVP